MVIDATILVAWFKKDSLYRKILSLAFSPVLLYSNTSSLLLDKARNKANKKVKRIIQWEMGTPAAYPPMKTLKTKPKAMMNTSTIAIVFSFREYKMFRIKYNEQKVMTSFPLSKKSK